MSHLENESIHDHDHRQIAQRLDLFHVQDEAPGMIFWHPNGLVMYRILEATVRQQNLFHGYKEVRTPQVLRKSIWESSGHWSHFSQNMFKIDDQDCEAALKPVSCPGHIGILQQRLLSYRDLPLRLCELGTVHRDELSGTLHGLLRVRQFTQDDGHVFCEPSQAFDEILRFCRSVRPFYKAFGFDDVRVALSTRPADRFGDDASWDFAENLLSSVLRALDIDPIVQPGAGAFYGPKLEIVLRDSHDRDWQCGTIQVDLAMPSRFDLRYVDRDGLRKHPVMLHRALYGSLERFLGIVLEHHGAQLPTWLAPLQVVVLPVSPKEKMAADEVASRIGSRGVRVEVWSDESLSKRIAASHAFAAPVVVVLGARDLADQQATLQGRGVQRSVPLAEIDRVIEQICALPNFGV